MANYATLAKGISNLPVTIGTFNYLPVIMPQPPLFVYSASLNPSSSNQLNTDGVLIAEAFGIGAVNFHWYPGYLQLDTSDGSSLGVYADCRFASSSFYIRDFKSFVMHESQFLNANPMNNTTRIGMFVGMDFLGTVPDSGSGIWFESHTLGTTNWDCVVQEDRFHVSRIGTSVSINPGSNTTHSFEIRQDNPNTASFYIDGNLQAFVTFSATMGNLTCSKVCQIEAGGAGLSNTNLLIFDAFKVYTN